MSYGTVQAEKVTTESGYSLGAGNASSFKNRLINGAMTIDQRNAGASATPATAGSGTYTLDRWNGYQNQASKFTVQQNAGSVTPPTGFTNYAGITSSSAYSLGATDIFLFRQSIEGYNVADLAWGTANAKTVTLSFWVYSSLTGTFGGCFLNADQNRSNPFTYTINSANTWEQKTVTVTGDTSGTWNKTNGIGLGVYFGLGVGSTYSGTAGSWSGTVYYSATGATSVVGTNGATWYVTGVQLEVGTVATSFDFRSYGTELALCQRYYTKYTCGSGNYTRFGLGECWNTTSADIIVDLPVRMRIVPTATASSTAADYAIYSAGVITACNAVISVNASASSVDVVSYVGQVASGLTAGRACQLIANNNLTAYIGLSSEL